MKKDPTERMNQISEKIEIFASSLTTRIDARVVSRKSKIPFGVLARREGLAWRFVDLCRGAIASYRDERFASAIVLTRASFETTAALWYLRDRVESVVETGVLGDIKSELTTLLLGSRIIEKAPSAINVMTFVDRLNKKYAGLRRTYDDLSEFAHPNWAGTLGLYSKPDTEHDWVDFSNESREPKAVRGGCAGSLDIAQSVFEGCYADIANMIPRFIEVCERDTAKDASR